MSVSHPGGKRMHPIWWIFIISIAVGIGAPLVAAAGYWVKGKITGVKSA